jgi:hypothetical protein
MEKNQISQENHIKVTTEDLFLLRQSQKMNKRLHFAFSTDVVVKIQLHSGLVTT